MAVTSLFQGVKKASAIRIAILALTAAFFAWLQLSNLFLLLLVAFVVNDAMMKERAKRRMFEHHLQRLVHESDNFKKVMSQVPAWLDYSTSEKVNFVNTALRQLWPSVKTAIQDTVKDSIFALMQEFKPNFLSTFKPTVFDLGNVAPQVSGINVVSDDGEGIAIDVPFYLDSSANVHIGIGYERFKTTIKVEDLRISGTARVILASLNDEALPCFKAILFSLVSPPVFKYKTSAAHVKLSAIPKLTSVVDYFIQTTLSQSLIWPARIPIPLTDMDDNEILALSAESAEGVLLLRSLKANGLKNTDLVGKSDPYCIVSLVGDPNKASTQKTKTINNNLNPSWPDLDMMWLIGDPLTQSLKFTFKDFDVTSWDELLGTFEVDTSHFFNKPGQDVTITQNLEDGQGTGTAVLCYLPFSKALSAPAPLNASYKPFPCGTIFVTLGSVAIQGATGTVTVACSYNDVTFKSKPCAFFESKAQFIRESFRFPLVAYDSSSKMVLNISHRKKEARVEIDLEERGIIGAGYDGDVIAVEFDAAELGFALPQDAPKPYICLSIATRWTDTISFSPEGNLSDNGQESSDLDQGEDGSAADQDEPAVAKRRRSSWQDPTDTQDLMEQIDKALFARQDRTFLQQKLGSVLRQYQLNLPVLTNSIMPAVSSIALISLMTVIFWSAWLPTFIRYPLMIILAVLALIEARDRRETMTKMATDEGGRSVFDARTVAADTNTMIENSLLLPQWAKNPSFEKTEWMNEIVAALWPLLTDAIEKTTKEQVEDTIATMAKDWAEQTLKAKGKEPTPDEIEALKNKYFLSITDFRLECGTFAPVIAGFRHFQESQVHEEVTFDVDVTMATDTFVRATVKAYGIAIPVRVYNIAFQGTLRVCLVDQISVLPGFSNARIMFLEPPNVGFELSVAGIPITSFPAFSWAIGFASKFGLEMANLLWPRFMTIPTLQLDKNEQTLRKAQMTEGIFFVKILSAEIKRRLERFGGKADPYVTMTFHDPRQLIKVRTETLKNAGNHPHWDDRHTRNFSFVTFHGGQTSALVLALKEDQQLTKNPTYGDCTVYFNELPKNYFVRRTLSMAYNSKGKRKEGATVEAVMAYMPLHNEIKADLPSFDSRGSAIAVASVTVFQASKLSSRLGGLEPYVRLRLGSTSVQSPVVKGSNPIFNFTAHLLVHSMEHDRIRLDVVDDNKLRKDTKLGRLLFKLSDISKSGVVHNTYPLEDATSGTVEVIITLRSIDPASISENIIDDSEVPRLLKLQREREAALVAEAEGDQTATHVQVIDEDNLQPKREGKLFIVVVEAKNLPRVNKNGFSDPYVFMTLGRKHHKTTVKKKNLNPHWREQFVFAVNNPETDVLELSVKDHETFHRNRPLGSVLLDVRDVPYVKATKFLKLQDLTGQPHQGEGSYESTLVVEVWYENQPGSVETSPPPQRKALSAQSLSPHPNQDDASRSNGPSRPSSALARVSSAEEKMSVV